MKSTVVVDANVLLRYLLADHQEHFQKAQAFMERVQAGEVRAYLSEGVVAECVYVLTKFYGVPRAEVAEKLGHLLTYRGMTGPHIVAIRQALRRFGTQGIDFIDAFLMSLAEEKGYELFSFDRKVRKRS